MVTREGEREDAAATNLTGVNLLLLDGFNTQSLHLLVKDLTHWKHQLSST